MVRQRPQLDEGYAWLVAFACFVASFIMAGLSRAAGVLYVAIIELYGVSREAATTPFSIRFSIRNMSGIFVGLLAQRYGIRAITITGGLLAGLGGILCTFAPNVFWLTIFWGGVHGVGYGLCNLIHFMILNDYFDKYKASALGMVLSGDCFGTFVLPVVLELLVEKYGVHGTFLILGGLALNVVPAGMLMKVPDWKQDNKKKIPEMDSGVKNQHLVGIANMAYIYGPDFVSGKSVDSYNAHLTSYFKFGDTVKVKTSNYPKVEDSKLQDIYAVETEISKENRKNSQISVYQPSLLSSVIEEQYKEKVHNPEKEEQQKEQIQNSEKEELSKQIPLTDVECHQNFAIADETKLEYLTYQCPKSGSIVLEPYMTNDNQTLPSVDVENQKNSSVPRSGFMKFLITNSRPLFVLSAVTLCAYQLLFLAVITVIIDYAMDVGMASEQAKFLIIGYSVADLIGRLGSGCVLDRKWISLSHFAGLTTTMLGLTVMAIPFNSNFYYVLSCMVLSGIVQGANCIMYPLLIGAYMEKEEEAVALGCLNLYPGLLVLPLAPMIGFFRDNIGSYDGLFWTVGGLSSLVGLLWILEPSIKLLHQRMVRRLR